MDPFCETMAFVLCLRKFSKNTHLYHHQTIDYSTKSKLTNVKSGSLHSLNNFPPSIKGINLKMKRLRIVTQNVKQNVAPRQ